ncbi:MAG: YqzL family protein [Clostridiales bacterium]|nr:YqzL family protein [Clostridiales bacterium]
MTDLFWNIFEKSGNLDAFMAYKEFSKVKSENGATLSDINNNIKSNDKSIIMR